VGEVGEEGIPEGIVAEVLDSATAVGVSVGLLKLSFGEGGEAFEKKRTDGLLPGKIDKLLMSLDRVGGARDSGKKQRKQRDRL
jgi:hypothetical protein